MRSTSKSDGSGASCEAQQSPMQPIDPPALVHFVAACQVAGITVTNLDPTSLRSLIQQLMRLSIPDAVKLLRKKAFSNELAPAPDTTSRGAS